MVTEAANENSYILPGCEAQLDAEIKSLLELRCQLVQSADFSKLFELSSEDLHQFTSVCRKSPGTDWYKLRVFRTLFFDDKIIATPDEALPVSALPKPLSPAEFAAICQRHPGEDWTELDEFLGLVRLTEADSYRSPEELRATIRADELPSESAKLLTTAYRTYAKHYHLPPTNLSRLMMISSFDHDTMEELRSKINACISSIYATLRIEKVIEVMQRKYPDSVELGPSQAYYALRSAVDRIAFHGDGDVLRFLTNWLHAHSQNEAQSEMFTQQFARKSKSTPVYLDDTTHATDRQRSELIGEVDSAAVNLERAETAHITARLLLESLNSMSSASRGRKMFVFKKSLMTKTAPDEENSSAKYARTAFDLLRDNNLVCVEAVSDENSIKASVADDERILSFLQSRSDSITESFQKRNYAETITLFSEMMDITEVLMVTMTAADQRKFRNHVSAKREASF